MIYSRCYTSKGGGGGGGKGGGRISELESTHSPLSFVLHFNPFTTAMTYMSWIYHSYHA